MPGLGINPPGILIIKNMVYINSKFLKIVDLIDIAKLLLKQI